VRHGRKFIRSGVNRRDYIRFGLVCPYCTEEQQEG
jgi:hypothetical protein